MRRTLFLWVIAVTVVSPTLAAENNTSEQMQVLCQCIEQSTDANTCARIPASTNGATVQTPSRTPPADNQRH